MSTFVNAPVGVWAGSVTYNGKKDDYTVGFSESGTVDLTTDDSTGLGTWSMTGDNTFVFTIKEEFKRDESGAAPAKVIPGAAYIQIEIEASRDGGTYTGSGTARIHAVDGSVMHAVRAETVAHQVPAS